MKKIIFLATMLLATSVKSNDEQFFVVNCGRNVVYVAVSVIPLGPPLSNWEICTCLQKGWRGARCNLKLKNRELTEEVERKNLTISNNLIGE